MKTPEKIDHFLKFSKYFRAIGDKSLAWKYIQKASEEL